MTLVGKDLNNTQYFGTNSSICPNSSGIFFVFSGAEIRPYSQWNLGDFFPNFEKIPIFKKK